MQNKHTRNWRLPFLVAVTSVGIATHAASLARLAAYPPDLLIEIFLPNVGVFGSNGNQAIIETGRQAALEHWDELKELKAAPIGGRSAAYHPLAEQPSRALQFFPLAG